LQYFDDVFLYKPACDLAQGHDLALLQAPPVCIFGKHTEPVPLNFGTHDGTFPLGNIASHFLVGLIQAQGISWLLMASFFRSFGLSS
jgi:hypothetical protein